jgi:hypothetical protein
MADKKPMVMFAASYYTIPAALEALDAIQQLHKDEMVGSFDAAVVSKDDGKPRIVKRVDRPVTRIIPEEFNGGALPRKELKEAAAELTGNEAGLLAVGEPTIDKGVSKALASAGNVVKRTVDASADEITSELQEALKGKPAS